MIHTVRKGDTLESIAQLYLYQTIRAEDIYNKNNLTSRILYIGQTLKIPELDEPARSNPDFSGAGLMINGQEILAVPEIKVKKAFDAIAGTFDFSLPNEPIYRDICKPYSFYPVDIFHKNDLVISGPLLNSSPDLNRVDLSGLGTPGILSTQNIPPNVQRQWYNTNLKNIANKYCDLFSIVVVIDDNAKDLANLKFIKTSIGPDEFVSTFLSSLARQRGLIITSTPEGALRISKDVISASEPVLNLVSPSGFKTNFDSNAMFSDYIAVRSGNSKRSAAMAKLKNDIDVFRCNVIEQRERVGESISEYLQSEMIRGWLSAFMISGSLPYVRDANGKLFDCYDIITIEAPEFYINKPTDFIIRTIDFNFKVNSDTCDLGLIPAEWYFGSFLKFWEK